VKSTEISSHLSRFRVGIAGAGGLGSNCAIALARSGVGTIVICDYDLVEAQNLNRQYYFVSQIGMLKIDALKENIKSVNPATTVIGFNKSLDTSNITEIFSGCDVIVEAFDKKEMKEMLVETVQEKMPGVPLVVGSGLAGWGNIGSIRSRKIDDSLFVCGDESSEASDDLPPLAPRVGIVANMQADAVVEILMKR
jgi:sulfur carrier protein ThiS adenylyltransferase